MQGSIGIFLLSYSLRIAIVFCLFVCFSATPHSMWDPRSPTDQGLNMCPLHWKHRVLTTGLPEKSLRIATG